MKPYGSVMNRETFQRLRHNIRASGWDWNWGQRFRLGNTYSNGNWKNANIALVAGTILNRQSYDSPLNVDWTCRNEHAFLPLYAEWNQRKAKGEKTTRVFWKNYMRCMIRNDRALFTGQLTRI